MPKSRMADEGIGFITAGSGICNKCVYVRKDGQTCDVFPRGIPVMILNGEIDHRYPINGDGGIQFQQRIAE